MKFEYLAPNGPVIMTPEVFGDERGYFMETFRQNEFERHCGDYHFVQDNQSKSRQNVLRGLHYQLNSPQGKLVRVISGQVFDVAIDLRVSSPYFGHNYSIVLDADDKRQFWVPPGFAHGFLVLSDSAEFVYKCTSYYDPSDEHCIIFDDPDLGVSWPVPQSLLLLSAKDLKGVPFRESPKFS